jgi:hypothetical protein
MKKLPLLAGLALCSLLAVVRAAEPNTLSAAEKTDGWKLLFDGSSLKGWRSLKTETPGAGWRADGGALVTAGKSGDIVTNEEFGDFELSIEWKISEGGNSGIIYRVGLGEPQTYHTGPEFQVLDNVKGGDRFVPSHRAGSLYDLIPAPKDVTKPAGEWNVARLIVCGWKVEHWLNGEKLVEADLGSPEGRAMIAKSKFKEWPKFATLLRGRLALQDHGDVVSYRNIKIRELK